MPLTPAITLTANLQDILGNDIGVAAFPVKLVVNLCNFDPHLPRIVGTTMLARTQYAVHSADGTGNVSFPIWGNDVITPSGTFYQIDILDGEGNIIQTDAYLLTGSGTIDLSTLTPYVPPPPLISATTFADDIVPAGTIDGTNAVFTLPSNKVPNPAASLNLFLNGSRLTEGIGYDLGVDGITITYQPAYIPQVNDTHIANYRYVQQSSSPGQTPKFADDITPSGTIDGTNAVFTLPQAPNPQDSLDLFLNGLRLTEGIGYTLSGDTITYEPAYIPQVNDVHICNYRYF